LLADRCRLFQPFFTTKQHGTGLGLFVSRQILEDVAGQLIYHSEPGRGSTFIVRLPLQSAGLSMPESVDGSVAASPSRIRIREEAVSL
jgi:signal transduction histidine kinase